MKIGDIVKAYDFPNTDTCYMEGRVTKICEETKRVYLKTTDVVFNSEHREFGETLGNDEFSTPMLGYSFSDDLTRVSDDPRLVVVEAA